MNSRKFKLDALLKLRKNKEQVVQRELGLCYQKKEEIMCEKYELAKRQEETKECIQQMVKNIINVLEMSRLYRYSQYLNEKQLQVEEKLLAINKEIEKVKNDLASAIKERKILENLQKRQYEQWLQEQKEIEQKVVDELVSYRYSTNEKEEGHG